MSDDRVDAAGMKRIFRDVEENTRGASFEEVLKYSSNIMARNREALDERDRQEEAERLRFEAEATQSRERFAKVEAARRAVLGDLRQAGSRGLSTTDVARAYALSTDEATEILDSYAGQRLYNTRKQGNLYIYQD